MKGIDKKMYEIQHLQKRFLLYTLPLKNGVLIAPLKPIFQFFAKKSTPYRKGIETEFLPKFQ